MNIEDFDFNLPEELIAQTPLRERSASRLMVLNRDTKEIAHKQFPDIKQYLKPGDCLVLNDTRVLPARLYGVKEDTGGKVEILLFQTARRGFLGSSGKPAKRMKEGSTLIFGEGKLRATCTGTLEHGGRILQFDYEGIFYEVLEELGEMPLPPYIKEQLPEKERYQTVYAKEKGSAAAPTKRITFYY